MRILLIPYAFGLGDLLRHEPLIRGIKQKYPGSEIIIFRSREQILKHTGLFTSPILSFSFDIIFNCCNDNRIIDFNFLKEKRDRYKEIRGYYSKDKATNQNAADEFLYKTDWDAGIREVNKRRRENQKNLSQWLCELCDVQTDYQTQYEVLTEEKEFAESYIKNITKPIIVLHLFSQGKLGKPFDNKCGFKDWPLENWVKIINQNKDYQFIIIGTEKDKEKLKYFIQNTYCLFSVNTLRNNLALIQGAKYFIGIDSIASHVAFALDIPSLVLYCELFKYSSIPINPRVSHILYSKEFDTVKNIKIKEVQKQFVKLIKIS